MTDTEKAALEARIDELCAELGRSQLDLDMWHDRAEDMRNRLSAAQVDNATLCMMVRLMHFAISHVQERTDEVAVYDGIRLTAGYFERRMAVLGVTPL